MQNHRLAQLRSCYGTGYGSAIEVTGAKCPIEECLKALGADTARPGRVKCALNLFSMNGGINDLVRAYSRARYEIALYQAMQAAAEKLAKFPWSSCAIPSFPIKNAWRLG